MEKTIILIVLGLSRLLEAMHCDKVFNYYEKYGNGFDVTCQAITKGHENILENITVYNEMTLTIQNSTLIDVTSKIFKNLRNIRQLFISNSTFKFYGYTESVFELLSKLEVLSLINTNVQINKFSLWGLTNLHSLVLQNNNINQVEEKSFKNVPNLTLLKIINNNLKSVTDIPLCEIQHLKILDLQGNHISDLSYNSFICEKVKENIDFSLNQESLQIDLYRNKFINTSDTVSKLKLINLSFNNITNLGHSLNGLVNLRHLHLEGNQIDKISYTMFATLHSVEEINLKNNSIMVVEDRVFRNNKNLKILNISNNKLSQISLKNSPALEDLNIANNNLDSDSLQNLNSINLLKNLVLSNNKITKLKFNLLKNFQQLELLNLCGNNIILEETMFSGLLKLKDLSISHNNLSFLPHNIFKHLNNLRSLDMSINQLKSLDSNDIFRPLLRLETLNLSYNLLQNLEYVLFEPLNNLQVLDIAGNKLHYIQYDLIFSKVPSLSVINIKSNLLSCDFISKMINFFKQKDISFTIHDREFDYKNENVEGIHCTNEKSDAYLGDKSSSTSESSGIYTFSVITIVAMSLVILCVVAYKTYIYYKRRKYRPDEFELVSERNYCI